ncbi:hypothetical protein ACLQ3C_05200 [Gordonia sp. DT30]|uniref:hypothetical protein n=1 Tax=unclassified Gordonia (in: high G+C Gram-positive bacteria) TaxID=2657482 RepID=UPI003CF3466B
MTTQFRGPRHRGRGEELSLADFPEWALDIMYGLYGPQTVDAERERQCRTRPVRTRYDVVIDGDDLDRPISQLEAELIAADALGTFLLRLLRRHRDTPRRY